MASPPHVSFVLSMNEDCRVNSVHTEEAESKNVISMPANDSKYPEATETTDRPVSG